MISHINRFLGRSIEFKSGFSIGFNWVHGNGETSRTSAILAGYHPSWSLTWGWALYWDRPTAWLAMPAVSRWKPSPKSGYGSLTVTLPVGGSLQVKWQPLMLSGRAG
jgi:hypothetical protein